MMKKGAPILILLILAAVAFGAYFYMHKSENSTQKPVGMIVSEAEAVIETEAAPEPLTDEEIIAFAAEQAEKTEDDRLKASTLKVFERYKGTSEQDAADELIKILAAQSVDAEIWTVIAPKGEKQIVVVKLENKTFKHLDPHLGVVAMFQEQAIIGPYAARFIVSGGTSHEDVFVELNQEADNSFYKEFAHVMMAPPGFPVYVHVAAPVFDEPIVLGELDGSGEDVATSAAVMQLTPYLNYAGRKHGEMVERQIYFTDAAQVTMTLTKPYDPSIMTANIEPQIDGNTITFDVPMDEPLILNDLSDDFIDVDQLIIKPL